MNAQPKAPDESQGNSIAKHGRVAKVLHWGFTVLFIYALTKQLDEVDELEDVALLFNEMVFATIFLAVLFVRLIYMRFTRPTALPLNTPRRTLLMAKSVHLGMYVSLSMIAVTGLVIGGLYSSGIKEGSQMNIALVAHEVFIQLSYLLILLHVGAAIYHRRKGDGIWSAMVPFFWKEDVSESDRVQS